MGREVKYFDSAVTKSNLPRHSMNNRYLVKCVVGALVCLATSGPWSRAFGEGAGMPFGRIGQEEVDRLSEFAKKEADFDLNGETMRAYRENDLEALGRLFRFSMVLRHFDANARTYGQIINSSLLNIGEQIGVDAYVKVIEQQPASVQRRIRNFLYYPYYRLRKQYREGGEQEVRNMYPALFPSTFEFGRDDPIFEEALRDEETAKEVSP